MGAGRKTETFIGSGRNTWSGGSDNVGNSSAPARNLRKANLGGVIFGCKHNTISECLANQLFGLPAPHFAYVRNIGSGVPLFLFNYSDRKLHGIYEAASEGAMNIDPYGWTDDGKERTPYPAQVRIRIKTYCQPLAEAKFRPIITDNYYSTRHFYFELDHAQVKGLLSLFTPTSPIGNAGVTSGASKRSNLLLTLPTVKRETVPLTDTKVPGERVGLAREYGRDPNSAVGLLSENKYASLISDERDNDKGSQTRASGASSEEGEIKETVSDWEDLVHDEIPIVCSSSGQDLNVEGNTLVGVRFVNEGQVSNEERVLLKLQKLVLERNSLNQSCKDSADVSSMPLVSGTPADDNKQIPVVPSISSEDGPSMAVQYPESSMLIQMVKELQERTKVLEKKQVTSDEELQLLRNVARESSRTVQQLNERIKELERKLDPSMALVEESLNESLVELYLGSEKLVYLIGGFDGNSWLSALDSYSPSLDIMTPLHPMGSARSYASATALNGRLYVFGGGDGTLWYDTVECYDPRNDEWTFCPPLIREKGSLAGATLTDKIFAIGGGNGVESFSDVEMFDPALGKWISNQSMLLQRFALAAAELNGVLYAIGGFDGLGYLKSSERFDPREGSWTRIPSMNTPRGCHSVAVLNEKLYAMGGYDGHEMVSSVEVFDPRASSWLTSDPMNMVRGYAAAQVLGDTLYVIGGVKDGQNIVDTVECYKEGAGWMVTGLRAVGKRCFFSAIVL
uniref:Kelch-like protein 12 n=1 Tax=Anthurium amnicola TaxID=1678845 RepID=A0A1D1YMQ1_9ARAE